MNLEDLKVNAQEGDASTCAVKHILQSVCALTNVFLQALEKKRLEQQLLQEEIKRINAETMRAKERRMEEEKLADMRAKEYAQKKQVR